jgi:PBP1b-binding outer membrane lipoprotein LpoB
MNKVQTATRKFGLASIMLITLIVILSGCTTKDQQVTTTPNGETTTNVLYVADPRIDALKQRVDALVPTAQTALSITPAAPVAPILPDVVAGVFGIVAAISTYVARKKNDQLAQHAAAGAAMAGAIVGNLTAEAAAMSNAATNGSTATVAQHLADAKLPV